MENKTDEFIPKRGFTGLWIPQHIVDDQRLTRLEMFLYAEIQALDAGNDWQGCFASNEYLGELLGTSEKTIANSIVRLKSYNLVYQSGFDGRRRFLKSGSQPSRNREPCFPEIGNIENSIENRLENTPLPLKGSVCEDKQKDKMEDAFNSFWAIYPKKVDKPNALKAFKKLWKDLDGIVPLEEIKNALERQKNAFATYNKDKIRNEFCPNFKNPQGYLSNKAWENWPASPKAILEAPKKQYKDSTSKVIDEVLDYDGLTAEERAELFKRMPFYREYVKNSLAGAGHLLQKIRTELLYDAPQA